VAAKKHDLDRFGNTKMRSQGNGAEMLFNTDANLWTLELSGD